ESGGGARQGARPAVLIGILAVVVLAALAAVLMLKSNRSPASGSEASAGAASGTMANGGTAPTARAGGVKPGNADSLMSGGQSVATGSVANAIAGAPLSLSD